MNAEERLNEVADKYRARGYTVVVRPSQNDLPDFARDFRVEIVARRGDGGVLAAAKKTQSDLERDRDIPNYVETTERHPGWRLDLYVLESEAQIVPEKREAKEPTEDDILRALADADRILKQGFAQQALIAAWAALEAAMRRRLVAEGKQVGWGSSPRTMLNELYSDGLLPSSDFRDLERLFQTRSAIVHGFTTPVIQENAVQFLIATARNFLEESSTATTTA